MKAKITARDGCTCPAGTEWFYCQCAAEDTVYEAEGHPWEVEDIGLPTRTFIRYVRGLHPAAKLICIGDGGCGGPE